MQFNSYGFILAFLPTLLVAYFGLGKINYNIGKWVIIVGSIIFYAYADLKLLYVILMSLGVNYLFTRLISISKHNKICMLMPIIVNISLLLYFKYANFAVSNINHLFGTQFALKELFIPVGISFFTFQQIAYIVAVYNKEISLISVVDYASYILYFPKLLMGPLMDPVDFIEQYNDSKNKNVNWDNIAYGLNIFSLGLLKKVLLADTFAKAVSWGFDNYEVATSIDWMLIMLFYTFEIYFDFSGYSDMAVGVSKMLNITLPINFDSPYMAISIRDFWKRWHISLTSFLTKYVYIPLGGSKKGFLFTCINTVIVFIISGLWHGANWIFVIWGLLHGLLSIFDRILERYNKKIFEPFRWFMTFITINILWLLFRSDSIGQWWDILHIFMKAANTTISDDLIANFALPEMSLLLEIVPTLRDVYEDTKGFIMNGFIVASSIICFIPQNNYRNLKKLSWIGMIATAIAFVWGITCLGQESVFVYYNF